MNFRTGKIGFWREIRPPAGGEMIFFKIQGYLPLDGDDTPRGSGLRFNLYSAILDVEVMARRINEILTEAVLDDVVERGGYRYVWDYFCLSFYNNITRRFDNNILNAIKEIIVVRDRSGNIYGGRKTRKRKRKRVKSAKRRRYGRRSLRRKKNKTRTKKKINAICVLHENKNGVTGTVLFSQNKNSNKVKVEYKIYGLSDGKHGFHVHTYGDVTDNCMSACSHFNPYNKVHGGRKSKERHVGDLGNIVSKNKLAKGYFYDKIISLKSNKKNCILGRSIVVHEDEDDLGKGENEESLKTGNAGKRLACGVIGLRL